MRLESGPSSERTRRLLITVVALLGGTMWFAYDGWIGWPNTNAREYLDQFPPGTPAGAVTITDKVNESFARRAADKLAVQIEQELGTPPTLKTELDARWFGPGGSLIVPLAGGPVKFKQAQHGETDLLCQKLLAVGLLVGFFLAAARFNTVRRMRYLLDDSGLRCGNGKLIPWDAMRRLDSDRYVEKGWVDLHYEDGAEQRSVRLDSYEIAGFDEIVDELCRNRGFENPLPVEAGENPPAS